MHTVIRYHDISCGHRVVGHENKCRFLHGHNYRIHFHCTGQDDTALDEVGRVIDFGVIKSRLCEWLETNWDHQFLLWNEDPLLEALIRLTPESITIVFFNPTAENMAEYLVKHIGPGVLKDTGVVLSKVVVEETRKCSAMYEL